MVLSVLAHLTTVTITGPEEAIADTTVAQEKDSGEEDYAADGAGLAFQKEIDEVEQDKEEVCVREGGICWTWNE